MPIAARGGPLLVSAPTRIVVPSKPGAGSSSAAVPPSSVDSSVPSSPPLSSSSPHAAPTSASELATASRRIHLVGLTGFLHWVLLVDLSVGKGPGPEPRLDPQPEGDEPARLEEQEEHDEDAEQHVVQLTDGEPPRVVRPGAEDGVEQAAGAVLADELAA